MAPKVFLTGATGYMGGDFLFLVSEKHPDWELSCLVRNSDKGAKIAAVYPKIRLVYGNLDAVELLEEEAANADIVYHLANCDHEPSAAAIAKGLARRAGEGPGYWIHTSGSAILSLETIQLADFGNQLDKVFDDWDNVHELTSFPDQAPHRVVDKIVLASSSAKTKTAIVCPPTIYGAGRGPDGTRSFQIYNIAKSFLADQKAWMVGKGQNIWHYIHIHDLSKLYLLLGEAAVNGGAPATWNAEGYYLAENGSFVWGEVIRSMAQIAHNRGLLSDPTVESLSPAEADQRWEFASFATGTNSRGTSRRARELLGWKPTMPGIEDELSACVDGEARALGLIKSHAATVGE